MSTWDVQRTLQSAWLWEPIVMETFDRHEPPVMLGGPDVVMQAATMGSIRRARYGENVLIGDYDVLVWSPNKSVTDLRQAGLPSWLTCTEKKAHGWYELDGHGRMMIDAWLCPPESIGPFAMFLTGPAEWNVWMRQVTNRVRPDLMLTQYGLFEAVLKPTKTYPERRVTGARVDEPPPPDMPWSAAEGLFWREWCNAVGRTGKSFPLPHERKR